MVWNIDGKTSIYPIIGDPIVQVKSPAGMTEAFQARGANAICIPAHVVPDDFAGFTRALLTMRNVGGFIATIPHKFTTAEICRSLSRRSRILGAANVARRARDGGWHGDMLDGAAFLQAQRNAGAEPAGASALLIGAGGAGSAIACALLEPGIADLGICDSDEGRVTRLIDRLAQGGLAARARLHRAPADPEGYAMICNASPAGMRPDDPYPVRVDGLRADMVVGDVVTQPALTPLIAAARQKGCSTATGTQMYEVVQRLMLEFFLSDEGARRIT
ncbi:shikimate dehydrogenase [Gluconacetobacter sp. 1b LMG 1731]|uniref:Shikimate dehydrogenase n=1 Tax=Gluconacetobacter dulcium TaxID=2729096 RepID=A0A7W4ILG4_9PROT|nr:shikimate dehydrogenase [Gluconacetobacter dulcium]MBB2164792.1 shikimate dehydrogenase [Gluconacetobacter dulcium]MBB2193928.1 shikimate dehydrogenase [Gluconacetobacter dulcium]